MEYLFCIVSNHIQNLFHKVVHGLSYEPLSSRYHYNPNFPSPMDIMTHSKYHCIQHLVNTLQKENKQDHDKLSKIYPCLLVPPKKSFLVQSNLSSESSVLPEYSFQSSKPTQLIHFSRVLTTTQYLPYQNTSDKYPPLPVPNKPVSHLQINDIYYQPIYL